jgi:hypothetical protein
MLRAPARERREVVEDGWFARLDRCAAQPSSGTAARSRQAADLDVHDAGRSPHREGPGTISSAPSALHLPHEQSR